MQPITIQTSTGIAIIALLFLVLTSDWKDSGSTLEAPSNSFIVQAASLEQAQLASINVWVEQE